MLPDNQSLVENKKRIFPRMPILIPAILVLGLAYLFYFNPSFLSNNLKKNLNSYNDSNKNLAAQNTNKTDSLIDGDTDQINASQMESDPIFASSIDSGFDNQLEIIHEELQSLQNKFTKLKSSDKLDLSGGELTGTLEIQDNLTLNATAKTESIIPQSDDNYDLGSSDKGWDNAYIHTLYGSSILTIGGGETSHELTNTDDLLISGDLEVNGNAYFDSAINLNSNLISNLLDPLNNQDAATKYYVDVQLSGLDTDKEDSLDKGNVNAGTGISISGDTTDAVIGDGITISIPQSVATTSSPTFAGMTLGASGLNMSNYPITDIGSVNTDFTGTGGLTLADALTVSAGGIEITGTGTFLSGVDVAGALTATDVTTTGDADVGGDLTVDGAILQGPVQIGSNACPSSTGVSNICIGQNAAQYLEDGKQNVLIGNLTGEAVKHGSFNMQITGYSGGGGDGDGNSQFGGHAAAGAAAADWDNPPHPDNYNSVFGFEAGMSPSYVQDSGYTGMYNFLGGASTSAIGNISQTMANFNHVTLLGAGASVGDNNWTKITGLTSSSDHPLITTDSAHGLVAGDYITFRSFLPKQILQHNKSGENICAFDESTSNIGTFRVLTTPASNTFTVDWCRSANGDADYIDNNLNCTQHYEPNWAASFASGGNTVNFSSCVIPAAGAFVAKKDSVIPDANFATCVGAFCSTYGRDNSVILGRREDDVYMPKGVMLFQDYDDPTSFTKCLAKDGALNCFVDLDSAVQSFLSSIAPTQSKLLLGWQSDNPSIGNERDLSKAKNDFTYSGMASAADSLLATGEKILTFDGTNDYLSMANNTDFSIGNGAATWYGWIKKNEASNNDNTIISKMDNASGNLEWDVYLAVNSKLRISFYDNADQAKNCNARYDTALNPETWYFFAITFADAPGDRTTWCSDPNIKIYINGAPVPVIATTADDDFTQTASNAPVRIGFGDSPGLAGSEYFYGDMGKIGFVKGLEFSATNVSDLYNLTKTVYGH